MTSPSQEHLLGYLLGALEPGEHEQFEQELAQSPELQRQLEKVAQCLRPLDVARDGYEPPRGLASRTCSLVHEQLSEEDLVTPARSGLAAAMRPEYASTEHGNSWTLADMVVAAGIFMAAGMLFFPAIANSRYQAQMAQCQNNFRQIGRALIDYSLRNPRHEYPAVALAGNRATAGIQAVQLFDEGYLQRAGMLVCPGSPMAENLDQWQLPTLKQIDGAKGAELAALQRRAGGSTAFSLGYRESNRLKCCKNLSRTNYALACDAPTGVVPSLVSNHHDGRGQNVVFECGRVDYVRGCGTEECGDPLFWNLENRIEAGTCPEDIVLAVPGTPPMAVHMHADDSAIPTIQP